MTQRTIKQILMSRDGMSAMDADEEIKAASETLQEYLAEGDFESAHYVCEEFFGLEPDYVFELIG